MGPLSMSPAACERMCLDFALCPQIVSRSRLRELFTEVAARAHNDPLHLYSQSQQLKKRNHQRHQQQQQITTSSCSLSQTFRSSSPPPFKTGALDSSLDAYSCKGALYGDRDNVYDVFSGLGFCEFMELLALVALDEHRQWYQYADRSRTDAFDLNSSAFPKPLSKVRYYRYPDMMIIDSSSNSRQYWLLGCMQFCVPDHRHVCTHTLT
jgi:hypothetical protein